MWCETSQPRGPGKDDYVARILGVTVLTKSERESRWEYTLSIRHFPTVRVSRRSAYKEAKVSTMDETPAGNPARETAGGKRMAARGLVEIHQSTKFLYSSSHHSTGHASEIMGIGARQPSATHLRYTRIVLKKFIYIRDSRTSSRCRYLSCCHWLAPTRLYTGATLW